MKLRKMTKVNKGFTLIEVCIASAILAIALSPFVANFVQASKMNYKARKDLNAMNLAQDMYEGMSVYTQSEFNDLFTDPKKVTAAEYKKILPSTAICDAASGGPVTNAGVVVDNLYSYEFTNVKTVDNTPLNTYDVKITVDGTDAKVGRYSNRDYAKIETIDGYYDAVFTMPSTEIDSAIALVKEGSADAAAYVGKLKRTMTLNIENKGDSTNPSYSVTVDRKYQVADASDQATLGNKEETIRGTNLMKADPKVAPRSVYLYFRGIEGATYANDLETIEVNNTTGKNVTVYLIRTIEDKAAYDASEMDYNRDYGCDVYLKSIEKEELDESNNPTGNTVGYTYLVSNLRFDLCTEPKENFRVYKEGSTTEYAKNVKGTPTEAAEENKDYKYAGDSKYDAQRAKYFYKSTETGSFAVMDEATYTKFVSDGYKQNEDVARAYDVTITITESGTGTKIAEYTGGIID